LFRQSGPVHSSHGREPSGAVVVGAERRVQRHPNEIEHRPEWDGLGLLCIVGDIKQGPREDGPHRRDQFFPFRTLRGLDELGADGEGLGAFLAGDGGGALELNAVSKMPGAAAPEASCERIRRQFFSRVVHGDRRTPPGLLKRRPGAFASPAILCAENQIVERKVCGIAGTGIRELGNGCVFERGRRIAQFGKAIDSPGAR